MFCAFVLTEVGNGKIASIDASKALAEKGVIAFFSAKDVPGKNLCVAAVHKLMILTDDELLFVEEDVAYAGQPVGVIVAETQMLANEAAKLVEVKYKESLTRKPIVSIEDVLAAQDQTRFLQTYKSTAEKKGK